MGSSQPQERGNKSVRLQRNKAEKSVDLSGHHKRLVGVRCRKCGTTKKLEYRESCGRMKLYGAFELTTQERGE